MAEHSGLARGPANWIAVRLEPEPGWHVYWKNPGDSGIATTLTWKLPAGVEAGAIEWPAPEAQRYGELTNYGYGEEVLHLVSITVAADVPAGAVPLAVEVRWLVCADVCIQGKATLKLDLPLVATPEPDPRWTRAFADARAKIPREDPSWSARFATRDDALILAIDGAPRTADRVEFFPESNQLVNHAAPQRLALEEDGTLRIEQPLSAYFVGAPAEVLGVVVLHQGTSSHSYEIRAVPDATLESAPAAAAAPEPAAAVRHGGLGWTLLSAFLGGLILNLMPCVFPILSLKALAVVRSREASAAAARRQGIVYSLGVVTCFSAVAGVLIALRAAGQALGWGFQFQSPPFVGFLAYLLFALGLSLSGVVYFGTRWAGAGEGLAPRGGAAGDFFTGVLAVVVASPCTAPFMGTALGYALTANAATALAVFVTLGLGMALPFLVLGFFPRLAAALPRPGAWMETFKQVMAFPLYLSVVWLLWVLAGQAGPDAVGAVLLGLVLVAFALWLWHRPGRVARAFQWGALAAAGLLLVSPVVREAQASRGDTAHEAWSEARVAELRGQGRTVFVDFTADWCLTCKVNERLALGTQAVQAAFEEHDVAFLVADWTRSDPAIGRVLERFGHPGVPLYLVYVKGGEPQVLPQILTPAIVIDPLEP